MKITYVVKSVETGKQAALAKKDSCCPARY